MNVDVAVSPRAVRPPDILCDARELPQLLPEQCADEVMAIHLLEHFYRWDVPGVLAGWFGLLKPGGLLVLELPNLIKCAQNVLSGTAENLSLWGLYGSPQEQDEWMCHRWGWTPKTLRAELQSVGFLKIAEETTQWHSGGRKHRDMRIVARRPA